MKTSMRVVCVGDSITFGEHLPTSERWTTLLAEANPEWNVLSRGVCGDTTRLGLERFPQDVQAARPNIVVINFGHNDANAWAQDCGLPRVSADSFAANLREMAQRSFASGARRVVLCTPHGTLLDDAYEARLAAYAQVLRVVAQTSRAELCDVRLGWTVDLLDELHPNEDGHRAIASAVGDHINREQEAA